MQFVRSTVVSAAALFVALAFTSAQAEPQQKAMSPSGPSGAGPSSGAQAGGAMALAGEGSLDRPAAAGQSDQMDGSSDKGKAAQGNPSSGGKADKSNNTTQSQGKTGNTNEGNTGKAAESQTDGKNGLPKDDKLGASTEAKGDHQGKVGKSARLESTDVSKVKTYFSQHRPTAHRIERNQVSVSIGVALPGAIALYDLPSDVIVVSGTCPIKYFVWEEDIVLVDSCTREVVEVIPGAA
jgi:hypothetical protein